ncbi:hypothetical protein I4U23_007013 [Adineta vaga]|nr:hypothetical protein I4U23_007013 [Adineta vaga]
MNSTTNISTADSYLNYYIVCSLSASFGLISVILSIFIVIIVKISKPRLHTVRHLLMCNTCISSVIYCTMQTINYAFLIFLPWITSDLACKWRGYLAYVSVSAATYSYLVQAISRLFFSIYAIKYPWLTTFNAHYVLILVHWFTVFTIPLSALITNDIYFRPGLLCWVPARRTIHMMYTGVAFYILPVATILIIYVVIYRKLRQSKRAATTLNNTMSDKRDLEVLRNIVILLCIYIAGGIPTIIFMVTNDDLFYFTGIVTFTLTVVIEKICTILLDRELRQVVKGMIRSNDRVMPFENTMTQRI